MRAIKNVLLLTVCSVLLFASAALAEKQMPKSEALKIMAEMQTLEAIQVKVMNAAPKGSEQADLALNAYRQTVKLRMSLQKITGVTYADLMEYAFKGLIKEVQRVQKSGSLEDQEKLLNQLDKLKQ
jgi:hypothetical protein